MADEATTETAPELRPEAQELLARLETELGDALVEHANVFADLVVRVKPEAWRQVAEVSKNKLNCDYLSFISAIDWQPAVSEAEEEGGDTSSPTQPKEMSFGAAGSTGRMQVFAHVESTQRPRWSVTFKTDVSENEPTVATWNDVYPGADWHERECWEMFGVNFEGHPHLRHLYLPSEFEGHPLRKDFPLLARVVKPWPGLVDVEAMPGDDKENDEPTASSSEGGES